MDGELLASGLDLASAARKVVSQPMDHFPALISDLCLRDASSTLAEFTEANFSRDPIAVHEVLTMPRSKFGQRPVSVLSPESRTMYVALVDRLADALVEPTRGAGKWREHTNFGLEGANSHIVDLDIAACYEYVNHGLLADELLLRSMDVQGVAGLRELLGGLAPRGYGIPQMMEASDRLADTYLSILDRRLARAGYASHRFADDIRVSAQNWEEANQIIEAASEMARDLGLVLSSEKTKIGKQSKVAELERKNRYSLSKFLDTAQDDETLDEFFDSGPYADDDVDESVDDERRDDDLLNTYFDILTRYPNVRPGSDQPDAPTDIAIQRFIRISLAQLGKWDKRLPDKALGELIYHDPLRIEDVCRYLQERAGDNKFAGERHWRSAEWLAQLGRQSPWAKVWLLKLAGELQEPDSQDAESRAQVLKWAQAQMNDAHETVRTEAAWLLAGHRALDRENIQNLYAASTTISRPALASAVARQQDLPATLVKAVRDDSPLTKAAFEWATQ